jgi:hypothetical protein
MKKYIVLWANGKRIGSIPRTKHNLEELSKVMNLYLIQEDITGTVHYKVLSMNKR